MTFDDGATYKLVLGHGEARRSVTGPVRVFQQDGRKHYEVTGVVVDEVPDGRGDIEADDRVYTVGFLPTNVISAEKV